MICADTTTTSASTIVGFGYDDPLEFSFAITCCPFDPADIPDSKRLSILSVFLVVLQRTTSLAILITFFSRGFQKNNVPTVQVICYIFEFYNNLQKQYNDHDEIKLFQTTSPFNYDLRAIIDDTWYCFLYKYFLLRLLTVPSSTSFSSENIVWSTVVPKNPKNSWYPTSIRTILHVYIFIFDDDASFLCFSGCFFIWVCCTTRRTKTTNPAECSWHSGQMYLLFTADLLLISVCRRTQKYKAGEIISSYIVHFMYLTITINFL